MALGIAAHRHHGTIGFGRLLHLLDRHHRIGITALRQQLPSSHRHRQHAGRHGKAAECAV